ncbi:MAG: hypothetical protein V7707_11800 [Motiliproteus sp.]
MNKKIDQQGKPEPRNKLVYYPLLGLGFFFLIGWFYLMRQLGVMEWMASLGPETYKGSFNMLAIILWMLPALLLWKYYLRWLNQRHEIGGQYDQERHDAMYNSDNKPASNEPDSEQPPADSELPTKPDSKEPR